MAERVACTKQPSWLRSSEVRSVLRITTCDLAHLREEGTIRAEKRGNAYLYSAKDVEALVGRRPKKGTGFCPVDRQDR